MDQAHGVDVSWMIHGSPKDKASRTPRRNSVPAATPDEPPLSNTVSAPAAPSTPPKPFNALPFNNTPTTPSSPSPSPKPVASSRPVLTRHGSTEKTTNGVSPSPQRRNSWFANISSKFANVGQSPPQANNTPPKQAEISVPRANPAKNAVLQHAAKYDGEGPYTPAPPKSSGQAGLLQVLRRLSSSTAGTLSPNVKGNHGLVERRVLNVDRQRERCSLAELNPAKLRRVAFCVDVEIAPMPKYTDADGLKKICDRTAKRKPAEKAEGDALKSPRVTCDEAKESSETLVSKSSEIHKDESTTVSVEANRPADVAPGNDGSSAPPAPVKNTDPSRKKEKKKKSEEERKARKEKKRKQAEVNGTVPMELHFDSDSSSSMDNHSPRFQSLPTTNPVRIYRRCCQLRETPILKKITEQLSNPDNFSTETGVVEKLDLKAYWMQLPDLVTLGDYLAVVPIKEVILESCGLNDEGLRVVLAGLLASKRPQRRGRRPTDGSVAQGGVVERLVLRNNKIGPEGWKHLCQFVYLCRSLKHLDVSILPFPQALKHAPQPPASASSSPSPAGSGGPLVGRASPTPAPRTPLNVCQLFAKCLETRLAGSTLELLNLAETLPTSAQLGDLINGIIKCGITRLGLARNNIDAAGVAHVSRYLATGKCEGMDLVGNDLREGLNAIADSIPDDAILMALNLAECNLKPGSLCTLLPKLVKLQEFRFLDLSHNHDLFGTSPSAISLLRRYLPKMAGMKRIHLTDVAMSPEQAIALAEILPEIKGLAHISLLENPEIAKLADAQTEDAQEEACALYASLLAATRVSTAIVAVDVDVPTEQSSEIVKALAKQVVAYCLRNMEHLQPLGNGAFQSQDPEYPDVLQHLVGHDVMRMDDLDDEDPAPDDNYVIGGTGVVKALACCLRNRGDESRRASGEFLREATTPNSGNRSPLMTPTTPTLEAPRRRIPGGKAKDMSKHLLGSARKIRYRLQPAIVKAKAASTNTTQDAHAYHRLLFLDRTLDGIIKRFEDEFPDTRVAGSGPSPHSPTNESDATAPPSMPLAASFGSEAELAGLLSEGEEEGEGGHGGGGEENGENEGRGRSETTASLLRPALSRRASTVSMTSKGLTNEEGRVFRVAQQFRSGWIKHSDLLVGAVGQIESDPSHVRHLHEILEELNDDMLNRVAREEGLSAVFRNHREYITERFRSQDPEQWERFLESQRVTRANVDIAVNGNGTGSPGSSGSGSGSGSPGGGGGKGAAAATATSSAGGGAGTPTSTTSSGDSGRRTPPLPASSPGGASDDDVAVCD